MAYQRRPTDIHNLPEASNFRKDLRKRLTPAEARLWTMLKGSQLDGRKFRRQHSVGKYILDFYCPSEKLAVELDGDVHFTLPAVHHDNRRRRYLQRMGIKVIRFENKVVFQNPARVLEEIRNEFACKDTKSG